MSLGLNFKAKRLTFEVDDKKPIGQMAVLKNKNYIKRFMRNILILIPIIGADLYFAYGDCCLCKWLNHI